MFGNACTFVSSLSWEMILSREEVGGDSASLLSELLGEMEDE